MLPFVCFTFGLAFLCGLNLYLAAFLTSLAVQHGWVDAALHPALAALGHPAVSVVALLLFLTEFVLDKIPWVNSLWDAIHTLVRPAGAMVLSWVVFSGMGLSVGGSMVLLIALSGLIALSTHLTKSGVRLLINASPEPFTNILASLAADIVVVSLLLLLINAPVTGAAACLALLAGTWIALPRLLRLVRTSLYFLVKKLVGSPTTEQTTLPVALSWAHGEQLRNLLPESGGGASAVWAVPCVSGNCREVPGLRPNHRGTLVAPSGHPGTLFFFYRGWFRRYAVPLSLAGCTVRQETTFLSENLVIDHAADGQQAVFRFTRAEALLTAGLVGKMRSSLGLDAPSGLASPAMPAVEQATEIWKLPDSLRS